MEIHIDPHTLERAAERGTNLLDIGEDEKIVGIEVLGASKCMNLKELLPVQYTVLPAVIK